MPPRSHSVCNPQERSYSVDVDDPQTTPGLQLSSVAPPVSDPFEGVQISGVCGAPPEQSAALPRYSPPCYTVSFLNVGPPPPPPATVSTSGLLHQLGHSLPYLLLSLFFPCRQFVTLPHWVNG